MNQKKLNGVLQDVAAKFCAYLVRPHIALYFVSGILLAFLDRMFGIHIYQENEQFLLAFVAPLIFLLILIQGRFFCVHFYKEKFRNLVPYNPLGRGTFDMPSIDVTFFETMTGDIGMPRKIAGYAYALSKPTTFTLIGAIATAAILQDIY